MLLKWMMPLTAVLMVSGPALADDPANGEIVTVDARAAFAPIGFDDNDESEVVVDGYLPSGCYRLVSPEIAVDLDAKKVTITPKARYFDVPCIEALVPYYFVAKLGQLQEGGFQVEVVGATSSLLENLPVRHAIGPGPDDHTYAPVDDVTVETDRATGQVIATLRGRFPSPCMRWEEARVEDNGKTINLLPIMTTDGGRCIGLVPYEKRVVLPESITRGRHLLHVRSLNGQAANHLFYKN